MVGGAVSVVGGVDVVVVGFSLVVVRSGLVVVVDGLVVDVATVVGTTSTTVVEGAVVVVVTTRLVVVGPELVVVGGRVVVVRGRVVVVVGGLVVVVGGRVVVVGGRVVVVGGRVVVVGGASSLSGARWWGEAPWSWSEAQSSWWSEAPWSWSEARSSWWAQLWLRAARWSVVAGRTPSPLCSRPRSRTTRSASETVPSGAGARNHHDSPGEATPSTVPAPLSRIDNPTAAPLTTRHHRSVAPSVAQADSSVFQPLAGSGQSAGSARAITSPPTTRRAAPDGRYQTESPLAVPVNEPPGVSSVATTARSPARSVHAETSPPRRHPWTIVGNGGSSAWQTGPASSMLATVDPPNTKLAGLGPSSAGASSQVVPGAAQKVIGCRARHEGHLDRDLVGADHLPGPPSGNPCSGVHVATSAGAPRSGNLCRPVRRR